ncbi:hypothetical protein ACFWCB_33395 [Streptomyces sp. NPDC060048]|uniref:hypothetical protein n=1 Tax=unclassified Streptomyces TaxID=2593676 RepID=UPI0036C0BBB4
MDGPELSQQERMILEGIEQDLRTDQLLDRRLRTLRRGLRPWVSPLGWSRRHGLGVSTCLLGVVCAVLFVRAVATSSPTLIWAFAAVWVLTLVCLMLLVIRWCRRAVAGAAGREES